MYKSPLALMSPCTVSSIVEGGIAFPIVILPNVPVVFADPLMEPDT